ncbi:serine hydroxymethyltransferase 2, mitochondrial [Tanacetum coccineum]
MDSSHRSSFICNKSGTNYSGYQCRLRMIRRYGFSGIVKELQKLHPEGINNTVADLHDQHGDMRLDVDNMSYEWRTGEASLNDQDFVAYMNGGEKFQSEIVKIRGEVEEYAKQFSTIGFEKETMKYKN